MKRNILYESECVRCGTDKEKDEISSSMIKKPIKGRLSLNSNLRL